MTTVYPVATQATSYEVPEIDMESIERIAQYCVNKVCRKWSITGALYQEHRDDMRQTAIVTAYEARISDLPLAFMFQNTKWAVEDYIWRLILGRASGHQWVKSRHVTIKHGYDESYEGEDDTPQGAVMRQVSHHRSQMAGGHHHNRPVEEHLIHEERTAGWTDLLEDFEQELTRILAAMGCRQLQPQTILNRARMMCEVLDGETAGTLADRDGVEQEVMSSRISGVRADIKTFLEQAPVVQGFIRAQGEILIQWYDEVTEEMINSGQRFIVVLPYGAFTISLKKDRRRPNNHKIQVQAGRRVDGKPVNRSCLLGKQGKVTYQNLFEATHKLSHKMTTLHGLADGVAVA